MLDCGAAEVPQKRIRLPLKLLISLANQDEIVLRSKNEFSWSDYIFGAEFDSIS